MASKMKPMKRYPAKDRKGAIIEGVYYRIGTNKHTGKPEKIFYISFYRNGRRIEEQTGREHKDAMTASKAAAIRSRKIHGEATKREIIEEKRRQEATAKAEMEGKWTFNRLWAAWLEANPQKKSRVNDNNRYMTHLQGPFGEKEPRELVPLDVDRLRVRMLKTGAAPGRKWNPEAKAREDESAKRQEAGAKQSAARQKGRVYAVGTVKSVLSLLSRIANFGVRRQLCPGLSFKIESPKGAKEKTEDMTPEQLAAYIQACREWPDIQAGNFQLLQVFTGMRKSEVSRLKWTDVDMGRGFILIRDPKGGEDVKIPLSGAAMDMLKKHPRIGDYVFTGKHGGQRGERQISESSRAIRNKAGLPSDFRPNHGLRHTFASSLASSGEVDLYVLQKLLTHKSPQMTQRYAHLRDEALKRGSDVMGRIVEAATGTNN